LPSRRGAKQQFRNGKLDPQDEIVFLWEDCQPISSDKYVDSSGDEIRLKIKGAKETREIFISKNCSLPSSNKRYIDYLPEIEFLRLPGIMQNLQKIAFILSKLESKISIQEHMLT
jgi:hypothetical protein